MLEIRCSGTPYEIGVTHGTLAKEQIKGSIKNYTFLFQKSCSMSWPEVVEEAKRYEEPLRRIAPRYLEEIRGIADGAGLPFLDILTLNVRTEINFGLFADKGKDVDALTDGCTSFAWLAAGGARSLLCQNWDWRAEQGGNLVLCRISQPGTAIPDLWQVTEAGLIGKIGINAAGVGCCLNAIRCRGLDRARLPLHMALRAVLESPSRAAAVARIKALGTAGSGHILVGDATGSTGLECTSSWVKELPMDDEGRVYHSNHLLLPHDDVEEVVWLDDSPHRVARIRELVRELPEPTTEAIFEIFKDLEGYPASINRKQEGSCESQTLFNIIMDLGSKKATVSVGRPTEYSERVVLDF